MRRDSRRGRLAEAVRRTRRDAGLTQEAVAKAVGERQPRISDWENEKRHRDVEEALVLIGRIDEACGRPTGHSLIEAGFVDIAAVNSDVQGAIERDPSLDDGFRRLVLDFYRFAVERSDLPVRNRFAIGPIDREPTDEELAAIGPPFTHDYEVRVWEDPEIIEEHKRREIWLFQNGYLDDPDPDPIDNGVDRRAG